MNFGNRHEPPEPVEPAESANFREPAYDDDPVAQFFAQERRAVQPQVADDLAWARITKGARRATPGRFLMGAVAAAAVAVVAGFGILTLHEPQATTAATRVTSPVQSSMAQPDQTNSAQQKGPAPSAGPFQSSTPSTPSRPPQSTPPEFVTWSLSNAGGRRIFNLGASKCGSAVCPVLLRSVDNGARWTPVHIFPASVSTPTVGPGTGRIGSSDAVRDVRFVTPQIGYVFGSDLWVTRDGGEKFSRIAHPGRFVLDIEASRGRALVVTSDSCAASACTGAVSVTTLDTAADALPAAGSANTDLTSSVSAADLVVHGNQVLLSLTKAADGTPLPLLRMQGGSLSPVSTPSACRGSNLQAVTAAADADLRLFALCDPQDGPSQSTYTLVTSTDGGVTWGAVSSGAVQLPKGGRPQLAAVDSTHLAAAVGTTDGSTALNVARLLVSQNGGRTFAAKDSRLGLPATGIDWIASPGAGQYYAVTTDGSGYYWSTDAGQSWRRVDPRA